MSKHYLLLLVVFLSLHVYNVKSEEAFYSESNIFAGDKEYFHHTVERGQTVYAISKLYDVSVEEIYEMNPNSKNGIKAGETLRIPQVSGSYIFHTIAPKETLYSVSKQYFMKGEDVIQANPGLSVETFTIGKIIRIPTNKVTTPIEGPNETKKKDATNALLSSKITTQKLNIANVALLLPFGVADPDNGQKRRFIEYYEGFLLAIDSLKKSGLSINLQVYDIGKDTQKLQEILKNANLAKADIIIGGFQDKQIELISNYSKEQEIPYVIPFTSKSDETLRNPYVYQVNTPQSYLYSKASGIFCKRYKQSNVIFIRENKKDKMDFVNILQADLQQNKIPYNTVDYGNSFINNVKSHLKADKQNIIIPTDGSTETLMKIVPPLEVMKKAYSKTEISLCGYPEWQKYTQEYLNSYFTLNTSIYGVFYCDNTSQRVKDFYSRYKKWYSKNILDTYPKYSILGYDTGMYFIKGIMQYGNTLDENINKVNYKGIQTDFYFERINNWTGFVNTNILIINFNSDYSISVESQKYK